MSFDAAEHIVCPNCQVPVPRDKPGHDTCLLGMLLLILEDERRVDLAGCDLSKIDAHKLKDLYLEPAVDWIADALGASRSAV